MNTVHITTEQHIQLSNQLNKNEKQTLRTALRRHETETMRKTKPKSLVFRILNNIKEIKFKLKL